MLQICKKMRQAKTGPVSDKIQSAYHDSKNIYDDVLTQGSFLSRQYIRFFWSGTDDKAIAERILSYVPDDFAGVLLDVPVGTAVFTERKWRRLSHARITCLDWSRKVVKNYDQVYFYSSGDSRLIWRKCMCQG